MIREGQRYANYEGDSWRVVRTPANGKLALVNECTWVLDVFNADETMIRQALLTRRAEEIDG